MMIAEITAGIESIKAATSLLQALNATSTQAQINDVKLGLQARLLEAQQALFSAHQAQSASLERIRELEQEIVRLKDWEADKQRYELSAVGNGAFAYAPKPGMENGEPPHWICASCYQRGKKSILQKSPTSMAHRQLQKSQTYDCPDCKAVIAL